MKSKDTATKRKDMRRYTSHVRDMDQSLLDRQHYLEEKAKYEQTPEFKQGVIRRKLLQTLDLNNRKFNPQNRIGNTKEFMLNTLECIYNELNFIDHELTDEESVEFMSKYRVHYEVIQKFDFEVEFNKEQEYTRDLQLEFLEKLALIEPKLMNFFIEDKNKTLGI